MKEFILTELQSIEMKHVELAQRVGYNKWAHGVVY